MTEEEITEALEKQIAKPHPNQIELPLFETGQQLMLFANAYCQTSP